VWSHQTVTSRAAAKYYVHIDDPGCAGLPYEFVVEPASALSDHLSPPPPPVELTSSSALSAFVAWIHSVYPTAAGYWTCPQEQISQNLALCWAEVKVGNRFHSMTADATLRGGRIVLKYQSDRSWRRRWSRFSRRWVHGVGAPGRGSVNGPDYDWGWIASGAYYEWHSRHHRHFHVDGFDGNGSGFGRFIDFRCGVRRGLITCRNSLRDSMRYRP
jgi:hypothetical protein